MVAESKIRVLTGKIGLDEHFRGIEWINFVLREARMEVVYLGTNQLVESMVGAAIQEDVDVVGTSFLCGGYLETMQKLIPQLREGGVDHVLVIVGGTILESDIPKLKEIGVDEVFIAGSKSKDIVNYILENVRKK